MVAAKLCALKAIARKFYCDKNDHEILMQLVRYSIEDIKDAMNGSEDAAVFIQGQA
jgi:hypothetical protein